MATCDFFARYQYGNATIELADNTTLVDSSDHVRFDVGRVVVDGDVTLTARDVKIVTDGVVSIVHFSWLNTMNVSVISGTAIVDQGGRVFRDRHRRQRRYRRHTPTVRRNRTNAVLARHGERESVLRLGVGEVEKKRWREIMRDGLGSQILSKG